MERVLAHAGVADAAPVTADMIDFEEDAFETNHNDLADVSAFVPALREAFAAPAADLQALIDEFWPELHFRGVPDEL